MANKLVKNNVELLTNLNSVTYEQLMTEIELSANRLQYEIDNLSKMKLMVVNDLPTSNIQTNVIYLVEASTGIYTQSVYIDEDWVSLGNTQVNLNNYVTQEQLNSYQLNNIVTQETLNDYITTTDLLNMVYPIGSIFMSVNNVNPGTYIGGTWERWAEGRMPVGVTASDPSTFSGISEKTGGSKTSSVPILSKNLPQSTVLSMENISGSTKAVANQITTATTDTNVDHTNSTVANKSSLFKDRVDDVWVNNYNIEDKIMTQSPENLEIETLPPYIACYMWKRSA